MFRKPKSKAAIRQRTEINWEEGKDDEQKEEAPIIVKRSEPQSKFSFDQDEGADSSFEVKKNVKQVEDLKRMRRLEEEAEKTKIERQKEEQIRKEKLEKIVKKEKEKKHEKSSDRKKYLEKYRDVSAKHVGSGFDEDLDIDEELISERDTRNKFSSTLSSSIPDSRAVYEAKKRRERARREGYLPLDDDQKIRSSGPRDRLVREDENDDSDEEYEQSKFYSARELLKSEEDRRREEQNEFLNQEHGDGDIDNWKNEEDHEMEEWEKQQIQKAVSGRAIGQLRNERNNTAKMLGLRIPDDITDEVDMDMDMDIEIDAPKTNFNNGPTNTGGVVKLEDILSKLKLRMSEREEALNFRREELRKIEQHLEENIQMSNSIEMELPEMSTKFQMYQELRIYSRSLLECLNEKVEEINEICDKKRQCSKMKLNRLVKRRRQDVRDQYSECSTSAAGKSLNSIKQGDAAIRSAEREARRGRRRRNRESTLAGISHEDGLSSDDEEMTTQIMADKRIYEEVEAQSSVVFADALEEFSDLRKVLGRMMDWLAVDTKSFQDAYVYLCLPKLCSPYVRLQLITSDLLNTDCLIDSMQWFKDVIIAGSENIDIDQEHEILVNLAPAIIEKVVLPFLIDTIRDEWDPMSLKQTSKLAEFCSIFGKLPNLTEKSKIFNEFLETIRDKILNSIEEDLFIPMFSSIALENSSTGCKAFHDRQYWTSIKISENVSEILTILTEENKTWFYFKKYSLS
ncbi:unnamed protein product [Caenorhabditis angaria]|uniref:GCF C-terminal domain-containing protein n=1 Tax=Caenorhabditis angaria TaxID=860376 RepID=A0A9P1I274_9PELO|nr:unnamed protein product [Caenorhabditis angaria]